jgi:aminoglycoside 6'-N-acetyltransferase I
MAEPLRIEPLTPAGVALWASLRHELWPGTSPDEHAREAAHLLCTPDYLVLLAFEMNVVGFAEATLRHSYVNGCDTMPGSPVAFLEGIYVKPDRRRRGIARALCERVADWARPRGVNEFASDALIDNHASHALHRALGFTETERVVFFRRTLT